MERYVIPQKFAKAKERITMFKKLFTDFHITELWNNIFKLKLDYYDFFVAIIGIVIVTIIGIIKERKEDLRRGIGTFPIVVRWAFWYACILAVVFFGAYGTGYNMVDLIYAGY